jgi:thioredoxin
MRRWRAIDGLCVVALVVLVSVPAWAQEAGRDQANEGQATGSMGGTGSLYQGFTPSAPELAAVSLQFRPGNAFPLAGCATSVKIRSGGPTGEVIATGQATVPPPGATPTPTVTFRLEPPAKVTPGQPYVIEWVMPEGGESMLAWVTTDKDTYAGGTACDPKGAPIAGKDFVFATYRAVPAQAILDSARSEIAKELSIGQKLLAEGEKTGEARPHFARILELAQGVDAAALDGKDWFAIGCAHCYMMGAAFDQALQAGGLAAEDIQVAKAWRDQVFAPPAESGPIVKVIGHGEQVNLAEYLVKGRTTIVDFYSEYCGPCRQISPKLEALAQKRNDSAVVKVDINRPGVQGIDWQSPVARQFGLQSIPNFKVYGPDGKLQGEGDAAYEWVIKQVGG